MTLSTTAAIATEAHKPFSLEPIEIRDIRPYEVIVEIKGVGLCHTDIAARDGFYGLPYPSLLGHEGSGVVHTIGSEVTKVQVGDEVAISFASCGDCRSCSNGQQAYCENFATHNYNAGRPDGSTALWKDGAPVHGNFFGQSSFANHAVVSEHDVVKVDSHLDISLVGPLGCGLQTGAGAILRSMDVEAGSILVVIGGGSVGLAAVMAGAIRECEQIIVVEPLASRRESALLYGATAAIDPTSGFLTESLRQAAGRGVDYIFDTSGRPEVITEAIGAAAQMATVGLVGVPADMSTGLTINISEAMQSGLKVQGIVEGDSYPQEFIPELLRYQQEGKFPFEQLITTYPLAEINEAVAAQAKGEAIKVVLIP